MRWHPTPELLPGKSHGRRSLVGRSPWGREESDMTERLHFHFSLSCTGEGNGNPLQCSCLENPRDGGAWWAAVYEVARSQTRLKRLSSSSSSSRDLMNVETETEGGFRVTLWWSLWFWCKREVFNRWILNVKKLMSEFWLSYWSTKLIRLL